MADNVIEVNNVSKSFGGVKANVDITMVVERGSITGIIGPNGCGKSTLFNSIVGYHPIDNGSIKFEGQEISHLMVGELPAYDVRTFQQPAFRMTASITWIPCHTAHSVQPCLSWRVNRERAEHLLNLLGHSKRNLISGDLSFASKSRLNLPL